MDKVIGKIYETTDYKKFKKMTGNRDLKKRPDKYMASIRAFGVIAPVIVNELFEVVDGQARLECCERLNIPVPYIIKPGIRLEEVVDVNTNNKKWTITDIVHGNAEQGDLSSKYFEALKAQFKYEDAVVFYALIGSVVNGIQIPKSLKYYDVTTEEYSMAIERLVYLDKLKPYIKHVHGTMRHFYMAVLWLYNNDGIDANRLFESIRNRCSTILPMPTINIALEQLQDLYNWKRSKRVYFVDEYKSQSKRGKVGKQNVHK